MKNTVKKIMFICLSLFLILYIILTLMFPNKMINVIGFRTFIIISPSMEPEIMVHDMILITNVDEVELQKGDIITFQAYIPELDDYSYVTHYLADIEDNGNEVIYKTQGANKEDNDFDEWKDEFGTPVDITFNDIEGVYKFTIPLLGPFTYRMQDPIFVGLLVINGAIIYFLFKTIWQYISSNKNEKKEIK